MNAWIIAVTREEEEEEEEGARERKTFNRWKRKLAEACRHGCDAVLVRAPSSSSRRRFRLAKEAKEVVGASKAKLIVGDGDIACATSVRANGVHFPQRFLEQDFVETVKAARDALGEGGIVGVSAHDVKSVGQAAGAGVDYVLLGTIFRTESHPEKVEVEGLKLIQEARESFPSLNMIGIGGINDRNCDQVMRSGANGVAVISYIFDAADAASAVRDMKARMFEGEREREKRSSR